MSFENNIRKKITAWMPQGIHRPQPRLPASARIVLGLLGLIILGTALLMLPVMATGDSLTFREAIFTAISALTVTGLSIISAGNDLTFTGQITLLALIQFGGVGYMVIATLIMRFIGRRVFVLDRLALSSSIGLDSPQEILHVLKHVIRGIALIEGIGAAALYAHWRFNGIVPAGNAPFMAIFHSISAFCNAGFDLFSNESLYPNGVPKDNITLLILGTIIFIGGLGIPVLSEFFARSHYRRWSLHTRVTVLLVTILVLVGWLFTFLGETAQSGVLHNLPLSQQLIESWFHSISSRTAGFAAFSDFSSIRPATMILTIMLMFIGCAPASMGGGITTGTFAVLWIAVYNYTRGRQVVQVWQRTISGATVRRAGAVLTISVGLVMVATFLILLTHPQAEAGEVLFEVVSAFATCGLSLDFTGQLNNFGLTIIATMMVWGRLGALTIVMALMQTTKQASLIKYPEETLLIG
ncbi:MAG: TrkH family potassium uptake protein [Anaerolineae bacterium]